MIFSMFKAQCSMFNVQHAPIISTTRPFKFKMADFDRDGLLDLGMIMQQESFGTDLIGTALGNSNGTFQAVRTQTRSSVWKLCGSATTWNLVT